MGALFYTIFTSIYALGIRIAATWNPKARKWVKGRSRFPQLPPGTDKTVWMHCASLGEFEQGRPLLEAIRRDHPRKTLILTFFSPSGFEVMKEYQGVDHIFYLPMDSPANASRLVAAFDPELVLWVKYEFWFHYLTTLKARGVPVLMVSGLFRESQPFFKWYGGTWRNMLASFAWFFVQTQAAKDLLASLAIRENVSIAGDTRFDRVIEIAEKMEPLALIAKFCESHKVLVAGSTWEEDEEELIHYVRSNPETRFIIAPHEVHEDNIKDVVKEFPGAIRYSQLLSGQGNENANVLVIDNIGLLSRLYYYADITYVGGGFEDSGIHNVLEPAVYGKPVIYGPEHEKFAEALGLLETGGGICINNALELEKVLDELWADPARLAAVGTAAKDFVYRNKGATSGILEFIQAKRLLTS